MSVTLVLAIATSLFTVKPPPKLTAAPAFDASGWFAKPGALATLLGPELADLEKTCKKGETGGIANGWSDVKLARAHLVATMNGPAAIAQATCTFGQAGFETHSWVIVLSRAPRTVPFGGTRKYDDIQASAEGLIGVSYLDKVVGAPTRCRFTHLGWSPRSEEGNRLVAFDSWEASAKGEGPLATCDLPL